MHDKGNDAENLVSIPKLLKTLRSSKFKDHEDLLNLIFEASGISDHLKKAKVIIFSYTNKKIRHTNE